MAIPENWAEEFHRLNRALDNVYETYWFVRLKNPDLYATIKDNVDYMFMQHRSDILEKLRLHNLALDQSNN